MEMLSHFQPMQKAPLGPSHHPGDTGDAVHTSLFPYIMTDGIGIYSICLICVPRA